MRCALQGVKGTDDDDDVDVRNLSLGAIWNFNNRQGSHDSEFGLWGTKGLFSWPKCIRTKEE
jgi:hypothetical protein